MYKKTYYCHRPHHRGLSAFVRAFVAVILLLINSSVGVGIVAADKVDKGDPLSSSTTLMVEDGDDSKEDSTIDIDTDSNIGISSISHHVKTISRSLRGNDHIATLAAVDQGIDHQLEIFQSLMKLQKEGNMKDKASTIRSLMGGLHDFSNGMKGRDQELMSPELSKMMETIPSLDNFEMDMATDEQLVEMFTHVLGFQDLDQMIGHTEGMKQLSRTLTDIYSDGPLSPRHRRQLKDDPYEFVNYDEGSPFEFGGEGKFQSGQGHFHPSFKNFGNNVKVRDIMKRARDAARQRHVTRSRQRGNRNSQEKNRRLQVVDERHQNRTNALPQCFPQCDVTNNTCNCELLFECVDKMSSYDITVLMTKEYIDDDGTYTSGDDFINVFDASGDAILKKLTRAKANALDADPTNETQCMNVLEEFHSTCNPNVQGEVCPGGSVEYQSAFQLSVDQVCTSVDTNTKLLFESIYDTFDNSTSCGLNRTQPVYLGCDTTYLSIEARQAQCFGQTGCSDADCSGDDDCSDCCTSNNKCFEGQGDCELDSDCQDGYRCGTDNCQSDFFWENGNSNYDCCEATGAIADSSQLVFDKWNVEGSSCGIVNDQTVFAGCGYTYIVEGECKKQCQEYGGTCVENKINIDGWTNPYSAINDENCGSVSFSSCARFAQLFDRLYGLRDMDKFPSGNPMLKYPSTNITTSSNLEFYNITFPTSYTFDQSIHGVNNPTVSMGLNVANTPGFPGEKLVDIKNKNIALDKTARQINTFSDNLALFGASNAVDGKIGTMSHTSDPVVDVASWWQVDLEDPYAITSIVIINRQDECQGCQDRLTDFYIRLVGADGITIVDEKYITEAVSSDSDGTPYNGWKKNIWAQYVRIVMPYRDSTSFLHLAEVQVYGDYRGLQNAGDYCLTGQFDSNVAKQAMGTCDDSMSLLLGQDMSLGTFSSIVSEVEEKGAEYMPGTCCLDDPITSEYFGQQGMECQNKGLWHLGLSSQACENAGGRWFRLPCVELKQCIDNRPTKCLDGSSKKNCVLNPAYSESFENFARDLVIDDSSKGEQCENARQGLGFDADYEFDTDVCDEFDKYMCDPSYDGIDEITADSDPVYTPIEYEPISYTDDPDLPFTALDTKEPTTKVDGSAMTAASNSMQYTQQIAWTTFQTALSAKRVKDDYFDQCDTLGWWPVVAACKILEFVFMVLGGVAEYIALTLWVIASDSYVGVSQQKVNYAKLNYDLIFDDRQWMYKSLNTMNNNINEQHITMRDQLEARHTLMVNDINQNTVDSVNIMGCQVIEALNGTCTSRRRLNGDGKSRFELDATWYWEGKPVGFMEMVARSVKMMIGESKIQPRGKGNKKKPKADKFGSQLFTNEDNAEEGESGNRGMMAVGYQALEEKLDEVYNSVADVKTDVVNTEGKMDAVEIDIADMKADVAGMKGRMDTVEGKIDRMEDKIDRMEDKMDTIESDVADMKGKMDTIIEMMAQLLEQEKLVKE